MEAGLILRYRMLLNQSPRLIRDRKRDSRTVSKCFIGSEAVDWLTRISPMVHGRFHAIAMLQALLEAAVITHGKNWCLAECQHFFSLGRAGSSICYSRILKTQHYFLLKIKPTVHTNPSLKRSLSKVLFKLEKFEDACFAFYSKRWRCDNAWCVFPETQT